VSKIALTAIVLWAITIVAAGVFFFKGSTAPSSDGRTAILLAPAERDFVLGEMRNMLISVQQVTAALAERDRAKASKAARAASTHEGHALPVTLMARLPMEFKLTGMAMHAGFGELADAVDKGEAVSALYARLADQLNACVGCHETYRVDPVK
jgi:cytochrome c556